MVLKYGAIAITIKPPIANSNTVFQPIDIVVYFENKTMQRIIKNLYLAENCFNEM